MRKVIHSFEVFSNESACRKKVRLGLEQVFCRIGFSPISTLCSACAFFPAFVLFPSSGNIVACLANIPTTPP